MASVEPRHRARNRANQRLPRFKSLAELVEFFEAHPQRHTFIPPED